jgi:hypothetical protein
MKLAEHETRQFPVPPANELRYAGRHLLDALTVRMRLEKQSGMRCEPSMMPRRLESLASLTP